MTQPSKLSFDELNRLEYEEYFSEMRISDEAKERRVQAALYIESAALLGFSKVQYDYKLSDVINVSGLRKVIHDTFSDIAKQYVDDDFINQHIAKISLDIASTTFLNLNGNYSDDSYWLSDDRAVGIAKTESNVFLDHSEYADAKKHGYKFKRWDTIMDGKERETHGEANGQIVLIDEPFEVGGALMMHPCDDSLGAGADEIVNCRCSCTYLK